MDGWMMIKSDFKSNRNRTQAREERNGPKMTKKEKESSPGWHGNTHYRQTFALLAGMATPITGRLLLPSLTFAAFFCPIFLR